MDVENKNLLEGFSQEELKEFGECRKLIWEETREESITTSEITQLLSGASFAKLLKESLIRTNEYEIDGSNGIVTEKRSQEFGFYAFRHFTNYVHTDHLIHLSDLIAGEEGSIKMDPVAFFDSNDDERNSVLLELHTHPTYGSDGVGDGSLLDSIRGVKQRRVSNLTLFSGGDWKHIKYMSDFFPRVVSGVATLKKPNSYRQEKEKGYLLLVSAQNADTFANIKPQELEHDSILSCWRNGNPLETYRQAGLNVAIINIDFRRKSWLNEKDVKKASIILTQKS